jgi:hypothetical protein
LEKERFRNSKNQCKQNLFNITERISLANLIQSAEPMKDALYVPHKGKLLRYAQQVDKLVAGANMVTNAEITTPHNPIVV